MECRLCFSAVGCVRALRVPAQGRDTDHPGADRSHQALCGAVPGHPGTCHLFRRYNVFKTATWQ
jgi:hypothetical protein